MFYRLFKGVNEGQARLLVVFVLVQIPISFILDAFSITSLLILKGEVLKSLEPQRAQELATVLRRLRGNGISLMEIFWGLWLFPMGMLAYQSRFIPASSACWSSSLASLMSLQVSPSSFYPLMKM